MSDLERRAMIHLLDGQQIIMELAAGARDRLVLQSHSEWNATRKRLREELEDAILDEPETHSEGWDQ